MPEIEKEKILQIWKEKADNGSKYYRGALMCYNRDKLKRMISFNNKLEINVISNNNWNINKLKI